MEANPEAPIKFFSWGYVLIMQNWVKMHINVCPLALGVLNLQKLILKHRKREVAVVVGPRKNFVLHFWDRSSVCEFLVDSGMQVNVIPAHSQDRHVAPTGPPFKLSMDPPFTHLVHILCLLLKGGSLLVGFCGC